VERKVHVIEQKCVLDGFFNVDEYRLKHTRFDGSLTPELSRLVVQRQDAVAAILWHRERERMILVEQFRSAVFANNEPAWTIELPAGLLDVEGETLAETMRRELIEETGYQAADMRQLITYYSSIGSSAERLTLFYAEVSDTDQITNGGGEDAGEDIRVVEWSLTDLAAGITDGRIKDSKTIIGVQWFLMNRESGS
jgi:nudix-type nucleoside diphosphatase (YffH/AdpP family)